MEIRCGDGAKGEWMLFSMAVLASIFCYRNIFALVMTGIYLLMLPRYLYCFRRFRMDASGVDITYFGLFQEYYPWDSFVVRQMVRPLSNPGLDIYKPKRNLRYKRHRNPVLLSLKPIDVPALVNYGYIMWHPLSCVFIGFEDEFPRYKHKIISKSERSLRDFEVNREEFVVKMKEWGIEIKGLTDQQE